MLNIGITQTTKHLQIFEVRYQITEVRELVNIQNVKGQAKPYQVGQFLKIVERYNLEVKEN